jgi:tRNA pseudouridine38-40 synthase
MSLVVHKITISYVGTSYAGWQRQEGGAGPTVQGELEKVVATIWGEPIHVEGSGRTDAGVHARGQTAGFLAEQKLDADAVRRAMNYHLPADIQISRVDFMEPTFHARFDVAEKTYEYLIWRGPFLDPFLLNRVWHIPQSLDLAAMQQAAKQLEGEHDFAAFATNSGTPRLSTVRNLRKLQLLQQGARLVVRATADGFLYHMVRNLTGALVHVGKGKLNQQDLVALLHKRNRDLAPAAAPAFGLYLQRVAYFPKKIRLQRAKARKNIMAV